MGLGGISIWQLLIILVIVVMLFGTKRLGSLGTDLGAAIKGFKKAVNDDSNDNVEDQSTSESAPSARVEKTDKTEPK